MQTSLLFLKQPLSLPPQHQFGVLSNILLHQVIEEGLKDVSEIFQLAVQRHRQQRCHIGSVSGGEGTLALQSVDELRHENTDIQPPVFTRRHDNAEYLGEEEFAVEQV